MISIGRKHHRSRVSNRFHRHHKMVLIIVGVLLFFVAGLFLGAYLFHKDKDVSTNTQPNPEQQIATTEPSQVETKPTKITQINPTLTNPDAPKLEALPILMYHFFYDSAAGGSGPDGNWVDTATFESHIKYLADNNYYFPTWDEVRQFVNGETSLPEKSIVITDDDGSSSFFSLAVPILAKYKVPVTSFIITSWTDPKTIDTDTSIVTFMSHSHDMHRGGCEGGAGGIFRCLDHDDAMNDLETSKKIVNGGDVFCYPFGDYTDQSIQELKDAKFSLAVTTKYGKVTDETDPLLMPRIRISQSTDLDSFIAAIE